MRAFLEEWRRVVPLTGLERKRRITPHTFRHTAASWIVQRTKNLLVAGDFLGHSDIRTTQIYAKNDESDIVQATATL